MPPGSHAVRRGSPLCWFQMKNGVAVFLWRADVRSISRRCNSSASRATYLRNRLRAQLFEQRGVTQM